MVASRALLERKGSFKATALNEEAVSAAWQNRLFGGDLRLSSGQKVQVVYCGRRNADAGPDFLDAIISVEGGELRHGAVEIHVRASDWRSHGHSRDRRYDSVVLHVVMWDDEGQPTLLSNGSTAPVLALYSFLQVSLDTLRQKDWQEPLWEEPCHGILERSGLEDLAKILDGAGLMRLASKAAQFEAGIACQGPEQALYEGLMEALGYAKNREPFLQLAQDIPLASLCGFMNGRRWGNAALRGEAILLGVAGLLPSQRRRALPTDYSAISIPTLEKMWRDYGGDSCLAEEHWNFFRTRPENFPTRRLAAVSCLIARSLQDGLVDYLLRPLSQPSPVSIRRALIGSIMVGDGGRAYRSRLIGRGRAKVIVVNIVLPFALAYANLVGKAELADRARWSYFAFPRLPSDTIVRQMSQQLFGVTSHALANSASRQQGLHHIFEEFCRWRRCGECLLSGSGAGSREPAGGSW